MSQKIIYTVFMENIETQKNNNFNESLDTENTTQETKPVKSKKPFKKRLKTYFIGFLLVLLLVLTGFIYYNYTRYTNLLEEAQVAITQNEQLQTEITKYTELKKAVNNESQRCETLITQEEGNFSQFSYCQEFLRFSETQESNL